MRLISQTFTAISLSLFALSAYADAQMFRPFQCHIQKEFNNRCNCENDSGCKILSGNNYGEKYRLIREKRSEYWNKQMYYKRHCGSAYINCCYPNEDYPRYNGPGYDLRHYQRKPYYPPFR